MPPRKPASEPRQPPPRMPPVNAPAPALPIMSPKRFSFSGSLKRSFQPSKMPMLHRPVVIDHLEAAPDVRRHRVGVSLLHVLGHQAQHGRTAKFVAEAVDRQ